MMASAEWGALSKNPIVVWAAEGVKCAKYWKANYVLIGAIFLLLNLLRLSESNKPGMYKLYYYLHQTRLFFLKSKDALENITLILDAVMNGTLDNDAEFPDSESDNKEEIRRGRR